MQINFEICVEYCERQNICYYTCLATDEGCVPVGVCGDPVTNLM